MIKITKEQCAKCHEEDQTCYNGYCQDCIGDEASADLRICPYCCEVVHDDDFGPEDACLECCEIHGFSIC